MVGAERAMAGGAFADTTDEGMAIASGAFSGAEEQYGRMDRFLANASSAQLKEMEESFRGAEGGAFGLRAVRGEMTGRRAAMRATRGGRAAGMDAAKIFGGNKKTQREVQNLVASGRVEEAVEVLSAESGADFSTEERDQLRKSLIEASGSSAKAIRGKRGELLGYEAGEKLEGDELAATIKRGRAGVLEIGQKKAEEKEAASRQKDAEKDPSYKILSTIEQHLAVIAEDKTGKRLGELIDAQYQSANKIVSAIQEEKD